MPPKQKRKTKGKPRKRTGPRPNRKPRNTRGAPSRFMMPTMRNLSPGGLAFLKCATAAPDFDATGANGVPDKFSGRTLGRQHTYNTTFGASPNTDTYIVIPPVPGVAYWTTNTTIGGSVDTNSWSTITYTDFTSLFTSTTPTGTNYTANVDKFRFISLCAELQCTMNSMTWSGNITAWRVPMEEITYLAATGVTAGSAEQNIAIGGFKSLNASQVSDVYVSPLNRGVYSCSLNRMPDFPFRDIRTSAITIPNIPTDTGGLLAMPYTGLGTLDALVFRVTVPAGAASQGFVLRTWACVEYAPLPSSALYQYSKLSAPHDEFALELYAYIVKNLPIAVSYFENDSFWQRVLAIIRSVTGAVSHIPGPIGAIASGVGSTVNGIASLF